MIKNFQNDTKLEQNIITPELHRVALKSYMEWLRAYDPSDRREERREYERILNKVIDSSPYAWRVSIPDPKERELFMLKFGVDTTTIDLAGISYSKPDEASLMLFESPENPDQQIAIPLTHLPDEYRLLTKDELMQVL